MSLKLKSNTSTLSDVALERLKAIALFRQERASSLAAELKQNGTLGTTKRIVKRYIA